MTAKNPDLHGNVPEHSTVALLLIDVINDMEWPGGDQLLPHAVKAAKAIAKLKERCRTAGIPTVYVNDNFGRWQSDFSKLIAHCCDEDVRGRAVSKMLAPTDERDYFVLKPKHSGFFSTTLDTLLDYLGAKTLVLAGFTGDNCVLFTASDAFMRDFQLVVPEDCVASMDEKENEHAIEHMKRVLKADVVVSGEIDLEELKTGGPGR
jgi:nicotinamidase-related amidase